MSKQELLKIIEKKRADLIQIGLKNGLTSPAAIQFSQELDILLNEYFKITSEPNCLSHI